MPEPILAGCMECINAKSQEEIELARRSKQIDRWPETWYLIAHAHIYILFVNHYLFWKFNGSMTSFLPCSVVVLLFFFVCRDLKREERMIKRQVCLSNLFCSTFWLGFLNFSFLRSNSSSLVRGSPENQHFSSRWELSTMSIMTSLHN